MEDPGPPDTVVEIFLYGRDLPGHQVAPVVLQARQDGDVFKRLQGLDGVVADGSVVGGQHVVDISETQGRRLVVVGAGVVQVEHSATWLGQVYFLDSLINVDLGAEGGVHKPEVHEGILESTRIRLALEQQVDLHVSGGSLVEYRLLVPVLAVEGHVVLGALVDRGEVALAGTRILDCAGHSIVVVGGCSGGCPKELHNSVEETRLPIFTFHIKPALSTTYGRPARRIMNNKCEINETEGCENKLTYRNRSQLASGGCKEMKSSIVSHHMNHAC